MDLLGLKEPKRGTEYLFVCGAEVNNAHTFMIGLEISPGNVVFKHCHLLKKSLVFF